MKIVRFEEIDAWIEARRLTKMVYSLTGKEKFSKDFGLRDQVQRASVSVMSNIAEGFDGGSDKAFINFLNYAFRSATEVQSLLYVAADIAYITESDFQQSFGQALKTKRLVGGLMRYLRGSNKHRI
jgi:four helix bundle protein